MKLVPKRLAVQAHSALFPLHKSRLIPLGLLVLSLAYMTGYIPYLTQMRNAVFDLYQIVMPRERVSGPVVIVDIDEASLTALGQWPWPRSTLAELVERIGEMDPVVIGIDIVMPEADRNSPCAVMSGVKGVDAGVLAELCARPSNDRLLAETLARYPAVLGVAGAEGPGVEPFKHTPVLLKGTDPLASVRSFSSAVTNIPLLHNAASGWGLISADTERGVIRQVPMIANVSGQPVPSLSVEMLRLAVKASSVELHGGDQGVEGIRLDDLWLDTTASGELWVHYSPHQPARFVSAVDLLNGKVPAEQFEHRFVLIGFSGLGLVDYISTPLGDRIPGVEVHAQILETVFDGTTLSRPHWLDAAEAGLLFVVGLLVVYLLSRFRVWLQVPGYLLLVVLLGGIGVYAFREQRLLVDVLSPAVLGSLLYFALLADSLRKGEETIDDLEFKVRERTRQMTELQDVAMEAMGALAESRDPETGNHIRRTQNYVRLLAERLALEPAYKEILTPEVITHLFKTAPLHDIGKVGVPDQILLKPGKLTAEEFEIMKRHPEYGRRAIEAAERKMAQPSPFLRYAKEIIYGHHEKWDGSGYPQGLAGEQIPLSARMMAIADVYDALINRRCYKPPFSHEKAIAIIVEGRGTHFDPTMVDAFLELSDRFHEIAERYADESEEPELDVGQATETGAL